MKQIKNHLIEKRKLDLGKTIKVDSDFNIKKYLFQIQKKIKLGKINNQSNNKNLFPSLKTSNICNFKKQQIISKYKTIDTKKRDYKDLINLKKYQNKKSLSLNDILSNSNNSNHFSNKDYLLSKNFEPKKLYLRNPLLNNKETFLTDPKYIASKTIKSNSNNDILNNFEKKVKKTKKNYSTLCDKRILYEKKYKYAIIDSINILKRYNMKKKITLFEEEKSVNKFLNTNREISINNIILKLLNSEVNNLIKKEKKKDFILSYRKNKIDKSEQMFEDYKSEHKRACNRIEKILSEQKKENRKLIENEYNIKYHMHKKNEQIKKILDEIDEYRIYGWFINDIFKGDIKRFEKKIYPIKSDKELNFNYELLMKDVIKNYNCFLNENDENLKKEKEFMNNPEKMINKLNEYQNITLRLIKDKENIEENIVKIKSENTFNLRNIKQRYERLLKEYNTLYDNYELEFNKCKYLEKKCNNGNIEIYDLFKDLYLYINNVFNRKNNNSKFKIILEIVMDIKGIINEIENIVDELIFNLDCYEKNDTKIFKEIINIRKEEVKIYKQNLVLQKLIKKRIKIREKVEINKNKIPFISRKTEEPYHKKKKIKKVVKDEKYNQELDNKEFISY